MTPAPRPALSTAPTTAPLTPDAGWQSFHAMGEVRCPGRFERRQGESSLPCNKRLGDVSPDSVVRVRVLRDQERPGLASLVQKCERCRSRLEIQTLVSAKAAA